MVAAVAEAPTMISRVLTDLTLHRTTTARQTADRLGLPHARVSDCFATLALRKQAFGVKLRGAYVWSTSPLVDLPPPPEQTPRQVAARQASAETKRRQCEERTAELAAYMQARRRVSVADVCRALGWKPSRAERHLTLLVREGRARRVTREGVGGLWVLVTNLVTAR